MLPRFTLVLCLIPVLAFGETRLETDLCIYGGTSAGVVAAVQGAKMDIRVILVEPGQHLGGMSIEGLGGTDIDNHKEFRNSPSVGGLALEFYQRIAQRYGRIDAFEAMRREGRKDTALWRFEPHVAEAVFDEWVKEAGVTVLRGHRLREAGGVGKEGTTITLVTFENGVSVRAKVFIDATYEGDLLAFAGCSFSVGREGNAAYNETKNGIRTDTTHGQFEKAVDPWVIPGDPASGTIHGVENAPPGEHGAPSDGIQGYAFRLCLTKNPSNRIPMGKPEHYDPTHYELQKRFVAAGGLINPPGPSQPNGKTDPGSWHHLAGNLTGWNHRYPVASYAERAEMLRKSRDHILGVYWFMANDPAVPEVQRAAWRDWGLCQDEFADNGGWPRAFYVRNGRRLVGDFVLTEAYMRKSDPEPVDDSVGLIWWPPDLHHARRVVKDGRVWNEGAVFQEAKEPDWIPCGIPYRCLLPKRSEVTNLLSPTCPSSSYVAYGAYRIEFTFMVAAQSAATAAAMAIDANSTLSEISYPALRERLLADGQVLSVPH